MAWYQRFGRHDLPWRQTRDPYRILVSEVMLQQTQVRRVLPFYQRWIARWPSIDVLAVATPAEVIREWSGLGYNRRALSLLRCAAEVMASGGQFPQDPASLRNLPGIGPYTANAVSCFAWGRPAVVVDTNIARVLARWQLASPAASLLPRADIERTAQELVPQRGARDQNLALMDLGAMLCTARAPACPECPLAGHCGWLQAGSPPGSPPIRGSEPPFERTSRFARGRIVDALRANARLSEAALAARLPEEHRARLPRYLEALCREGLVEASGLDWTLSTRLKEG